MCRHGIPKSGVGLVLNRRLTDVGEFPTNRFKGEIPG
jgi:hypothetical protein